MKLILCPRFGNTWVHFDHYLQNDAGEEYASIISKTNWGYGDPPYPSFHARNITHDYISSPDKKEWRKNSLFEGHGNWDSELDIKDFLEEWPQATEVIVQNPIYIDPTTATIWMPRKRINPVFSKRLWLFKTTPKKEPIWMLENLGYFSKKRSESAFLSGELLKLLNPWADDPRKFLYDNTKQDKALIVKSLARQLKKLIKSVKPISEQTKKFFKLAGAFKHLKQQKQKYAY